MKFIFLYLFVLFEMKVFTIQFELNMYVRDLLVYEGSTVFELTIVYMLVC